MGSACCVAAKHTANGASSDIFDRNMRYSPSWSFRWDSRGRVSGEEPPINSSSHRVNINTGLDTKSRSTSEMAYASEEGSPVDSFRNLTWQKSSNSEETARASSLPQADVSISTNSVEARSSTESRAVSVQFQTKMSPSLHSNPSLPTSPLSSSSQSLHPQSSTPLRWSQRSRAQKLLRQVSGHRRFSSPNFSISEDDPTFSLQGWSYGSYRNSHGGSSDDSLNTETRDRISRTTSGCQTCAVCLRVLTMKTTAVIAILMCGHVYHAECLEKLTPEISKFDPACPVCTFGEKQALVLYEKALRGELDLKFRSNKWLMKQKSSSFLSVKPFLKRHFSFKGSSRLSLNHSSTRRKGLFWSKSSRE